MRKLNDSRTETTGVENMLAKYDVAKRPMPVGTGRPIQPTLQTMKDLSKPLNDEEIERLDQLLLDRVDDDADVDGTDEGVLGVSELDGFFTALVSGPAAIPFSSWLPVVWGDFQPVWASKKDFEDVFSLMTRHMNSIAATLVEQPKDFEPVFQEREVEGKIYTIVDEWCEGYLRGVALAADAWNAGGQQMTDLLDPIRAFTSETNWRAHDLPTDAESDQLRDAITPNIRAIHAVWLAQRAEHAPSSAPARRVEPRVGRNEPCPCGSGKKFKNCCLH